MANPTEGAARPVWPLVCMGLLLLACLGIALSLVVLGRLGVDGAFALSALSLGGLLLGIGGLQYWAVLDLLRSSRPTEERILYLGLIFLLVPVGAILYYGLKVRAIPPPQTSPPD